MSLHMWCCVGIPEAHCVLFSAISISAGIEIWNRRVWRDLIRPRCTRCPGLPCCSSVLNQSFESSCGGVAKQAVLSVLETHSCTALCQAGGSGLLRPVRVCSYRRAEVKQHADLTLRFHSVLSSRVVIRTVHQEHNPKRDRPRFLLGVIRHATLS